MKKLIMASITAVVVVAVLAGTLIPILDDATATSDTFTNDGLIYMDKYGTDTEITISWDHTDPANITVNNEVIPLYTATTVTVSSGFNWILRSSATGITYFSNTIVEASTTAGTDLNVTISNGTITATNTATTPVTATSTYTEVYVISDNGSYVMKNMNETAYINSDTLIVGSGMSVVGGIGGYGYNVVGSIDDGATVTQFRGSITTNGDVTINYEEVESHKDLYKFSNMTFKANDSTLTWGQVIVPVEITAERSVHFTDGENAIFNAIPVIVIVALLLAVVAMVIRSRMD